MAEYIWRGIFRGGANWRGGMDKCGSKVRERNLVWEAGGRF